MATDGKRKIAIAASLLWMAVATIVVLGTHGQAVARADAPVPAIENGTEWMAHPADIRVDAPTLDLPTRC